MIVKGWNVTRNKEYGFSLWEVIVAISVVAVLGTVFLPNLSSTINYGSRQKTDARLDTLRTAVISSYENSAMAIDDNGGKKIELLSSANAAGLSGGSLTDDLSRQPGQRESYQSGFDVLARYAGSSGARLAEDGFGQPWHVFVTGRLSRKWRGHTVYYHVVAFVSNGGDEITNGQVKLDSATSFDDSTGELSLGGNDVGITVSGYPIQVAYFKETLKRMRRVADTYETFFHANYLGSTQRDATVDYFSKSCPSSAVNQGRYHNSNVMDNSCGDRFRYPSGGVAVDFTANDAGSCNDSSRLSKPGNGHKDAFGLSDNELTSAWGYPMGYGVGPNANCGFGDAHSRNPSSTYPNARTPPFTALIQAWAPGAVPLVVVAIGTY